MILFLVFIKIEDNKKFYLHYDTGYSAFLNSRLLFYEMEENVYFVLETCQLLEGQLKISLQNLENSQS